MRENVTARESVVLFPGEIPGAIILVDDNALAKLQNDSFEPLAITLRGLDGKVSVDMEP